MLISPRLFAALLVLMPLTLEASTGEELAAAARRGDVAGLEELLKQGLDADSRQADGTSALHWAVLDGRHAAVDYLVKAGVDVNAADRYGTTPLSLAALNGDPVAVSTLLDGGANPNVLDAAQESALMTAARTGDEEVVDLLLQHGALVGYREPVYGLSALMLASLENHPGVVHRLVSLGARVNDHTHVGPTPPFVLPCKGGCGSEGLGMNAGGVPDRGDRPEVEGGMTPLLYAARDGKREVAQILLSGGASLEQAEGNQITPLLMALINGQVELAQLLLDHGADVNAADFYGRRPLFAAVEYRNLDMDNNNDPAPVHNGVDRAALLPLIERLLNAGADVNTRTREYPPPRRWIHVRNDISWVDMTGQTPFVRAALGGDVTVMRLLLEHGADPLITTYGGTSALMAAAGLNWREGQTYTESRASLLEAVKLCLERGVDINAVNSMGITALMGAANRGSHDIVELLAAEGAKLDMRDGEGRSAMTWANGVFLGDLAAQAKPDTIAVLRALGARED